MDYTDVFTTHDFFSSREELISWVRSKGNEHGLVTIVRRSDSGLGKKKPRLLLTCERDGQYTGSKKVAASNEKNDQGEIIDKVDVNKRKTRKSKGSKKTGCPFRLRGSQILEGQWSLVVQCGVHDHENVRHLDNTKPNACFEDRVEEEHVADILHDNTKPNACSKDRVIEHDDQSQMQQLIQKLKTHGYLYYDRRCEKTNIVKDLFFAHPTSVDLLRAFPKVIFMDCTSKTNRYNLPLLEIVGVTSTQMTFFIAAAYLEFEHEENYTWACTCLKALMEQSVLPNVIVTDREIALMKALESTFPTSKYFLCRWHINNNIMVTCKKILKEKEKCDLFNMHWNMVVSATTESSFNDNLNRLQSEFKGFPEAINYIILQWVEPYKERFVACWTNTVMHYDNNTTLRVKGEYASLKKQLSSSQGDFEKCWKDIHTLIETSHSAIKLSFEKSKTVLLHKFRSDEFIFLRGMVSIQALERIHEILTIVRESDSVDPLLCGCVPRKTCGLPCLHEVAEYVRLGESIPLEHVDPFWRKLDILPIKGEDEIDREICIEWEKFMNDLNARFQRGSTTEKLLLLKRIREIASSMVPPVEIQTQGRPWKRLNMTDQPNVLE